MKKRLGTLLAAALLLALLALSGCTTAMSEYESDTFELGGAAAVMMQP